MVAIFTGAGTGFERGSGNVLGGGGLLGSAAQGRGGDNVFLNAANGNLLISRQDEFLSGRGPDVGITRTYNSLGNFSDDNGDNWRQSMDRRVAMHSGSANTPGSVVKRVGADGSETFYSINSSGTYYVGYEGSGAYDTLEYNGTSWTWIDGDSRTTEVYSAYGSEWRIASQTDTSGNSLTFSYTGDKLTRVITADGGYTEINWSGSNIYALYTYSHGTGLTRTRYSYDGDNRLSTLTVDLTPNDTTVGDGNVYTTTYTYHGTSKLVATISQTDGSYVAFGYDGSSRVTSIAQTVSSGVTRTTGIAYGAGYTTVTDPMGQATTLRYDANGQLTQITAPPATAGAPAQTVHFAYNANGDLIRSVDAGGKVTSYTYDGWGNVLTRSDATSVAISSGINAIATLQPDGTYRVTKTSGSSGTYDGQVQSAQGISGDFAFRMRPLQTNQFIMAGVSQHPNSSTQYTNLDFGVEASVNGYFYYYENGAGAQALTSYNAGDSIWIVRTGSTINYYKGDTLDAARAAGSLRAVSGVSGTFYADAALYTIGAVADMSFTPTSIEESFNVVTRTYNAANQVVTETRTGSNGQAASASHTNRYVYDAGNRLIYTVSAEGYVTRYFYSSEGLNTWVYEFPAHLYDVSALAPSTALSQTQLDSWYSNLEATAGGTSQFNIRHIGYDLRGNVAVQIQGGSNNGAGSITETDGYQHAYSIYDQAGQLLSRYKLTQNVEHFAYDGLGRVTSSTDLNGGVTSIYFNDAATQTTVTLAGGLVRTSTYSKAGELLSVTEGGAYTIGGTAYSAYDRNGRLRVVTDATGNKSYFLYDHAGRKVADVGADGSIVEYRYDARNRMTARVRYYSQLTTAQLSLVADPNTYVDIASIRPAPNAEEWVWTVYDADGRVLQSIDGDGSTTSYDYDASGQLIRTTGYYNKLTAGQLAAFKIASPIAVVLPSSDTRDAVSRVFYDKDGRVRATLDGAGYLTRTAYDSAGRKVKTVAYATATDPALRASGTFQQLLASTGPASNPANRETLYVYDGQNLLRYQIDTLGYVTEYGYDSGVPESSVGLVRSVTTYATPLVSPTNYYPYVKAAIASAGLASNPANRTSWAVYDAAGRVAYAIDAGGAVTGFSYDTSGRVTRKVAYANLRATTSLPTQAYMNAWASANAAGSDRATRYYYDALGQLRFAIDPEGYIARTDYDAEGRVSSRYRYDTAVSANDSWTIANLAGIADTYSSTSVTYDGLGRVLFEYDAMGSVTYYWYRGNGQLGWVSTAYATADQVDTVFYYDESGRVHTRVDANGTAEATTTQYAYDGLGNLVSLTDPLNRVTTYTHDSLGRVLTQTNAASGMVSYQYNAFGNVVRTTDQRSNSTYNYYDSYGRVIASRDAENYLTLTSYTAFGEVETVTRKMIATDDPISLDVIPTTDPHVNDATTRFTYDKLGRVKTTTDAEGATETRWYDAFGQVDQTQSKLGLIVQYGHDRRGNVLWDYMHAPVFNSVGDQTAPGFARNHYYYDSRSNLIHQIEALNLAEQRDTYFAYDKADRLISKTGGPVKTGLGGAEATPTETYIYDTRGNLIETKVESVVGSTRTLISRTLSYYDDLDRKVGQIDPTGAVVQYIYDAAGNLKQSRAFNDRIALPPTPGGAFNAPTGSARDTYFNYDNLNRLTSSYIDAGRTGYWNGSVFVTQTGPAYTYYEYDAAGNVIRTTDPNGAITLTSYDKLGRKTAQVDQEGYQTSWKYDAEGNVLKERRFVTRPPANGPLFGVDDTTVPNDRVTEFVYDKLGRRVTEARHWVEAWSIDAAGVLTPVYDHATLTYYYNPLGQVRSKTEANGDTTFYEYDNAGRLTKETRPKYDNYAGGEAIPELRYFYNGLDQLTATRQTGNGSTVSDRITGNSYEDGRLTSTTDASGFTRNYHYDAAGRLVAESYDRKLSNETTVREAIFYVHDAAGRVVTQSFARWDGSAWTHADANGQYYDATRMRYNAHGELTGRGITAGPWATAAYQEYYDYDASGRVLRSNAGDGVVKYFAYDKVGNQTLTLTSEGSVDLTAINYTDLIDAIDGNTDTAHSGIAATLTVYDRRGMVTQTRAPGRNLSTTTSATTDLIASRSYNAFGEVLSETDARGYTTSFAYNNMGRLLRKESPTVKVVHEHGGTQWIKPSEDYYYDISGRLIGTRDANGAYGTYGIDGTAENAPATKQANTGNLTRRLLLAGTGHGGSEALTTKEFRAGGGLFQTFYDRFGDARILRNELGHDEQYEYDGMGRVSKIIRRGGLLTEEYLYDGLGQRIQQWNSFQGAGNKALTDYDIQGRVISSVAIGGDTTTTSYQWSYTLATSGLGTFGGWVKTTANAVGRTMTERHDMFDRLVDKIDFGGNDIDLTFDKGGHLATQTVGGGTMTFSWLNTGLIGSVTTTGGSGFDTIVSTYGYDAAGNRTFEGQAGTVHSYYLPWGTTSAWQSLQNTTITYDALGRMTQVTDRDASNNIRASITNSYDANGNVRRTQTTYPNLAYPQYGNINEDKWYRYDSMNRMTVADGILYNNQVVSGYMGTDITYDAAGRRATATRKTSLTGQALSWYWYPGRSPEETGWAEPMSPGYNGDYEYQTTGYTGDRREEYRYNANGELIGVYFADEGYADNGDGTLSGDGTIGPAVQRAKTDRDALGRTTQYQEYDAAGAVTQNRYNIAYNAAGQVTSESVSQLKVENGWHNIYVTHTINDYGAGGLLRWTTVTTLKNNDDGAVPNTRDDYAYSWADDARMLTSTHDSDTGSGSNPTWTSSYTYDGLGRLAYVHIADGRTRTVSFASNAEGQVLLRKERSAAAANPEDQRLFVAGVEVGSITNNGNNDPAKATYSQNLDYIRNWTPNSQSAAFRWNTNGGVTDGSYGPPGYDPINPYSDGVQGAGSTGYMVRSGDTLGSIATQLWGDASQWYRIAEANGLSSAAALVAGTQLRIPDQLPSAYNNASRFRPYDAAGALGDLSPTAAPKPPKKNGCGIVGQVLLFVVAIAVTAILKAPVAKLFAGLGKVGGAIATGATLGAVSNAASQGVGIATGIQQGGFNWGAVGMHAISGGVGGGLGAQFENGILGTVSKSSFINNAANGAAFSLAHGLISQSLNVATGLQKKFDWAGVAAATLGGGIGAGVAGAGGGAMAVFAADGLASAAARSLITGTSFGDNLIAVLPSVIGRTIGSLVARSVTGERNTGSRSATSENAGSAEGEVTNSAEPGEIVITGSRRYGDWVDPFPSLTATLFNFDRQTGGVEHAKTMLRERIVADLAARKDAKSSGITLAGIDMIDGFKDGAPTEGGSALTENALNERYAYWKGAGLDPKTWKEFESRIESNRSDLARWNGMADAAVGDVANMVVDLGSWTAVGGGISVIRDLARGDFSIDPVAMLGYGVDVAGRKISVLHDAARVAGDAAPEIKVLFGQKRVGPTFGIQGRPDYLAGRTISDVAGDLRSGALHPDQLPIDAFRYGDDLVSANTRSLAALSEAGLRPTIVNEIQPTNALLRRLRETPIISNAPLPGPRVPVTPSQSNLDILRIIELAK